MLDYVFDFLSSTQVASIAALLIGCYILRDTVRACFHILDSSRSRRREGDGAQ